MDGEPGAALEAILGPHASAFRSEQSARNREPHARSHAVSRTLLSSVEGLEQPRRIGRRNPVAFVFDGDKQPIGDFMIGRSRLDLASGGFDDLRRMHPAKLVRHGSRLDAGPLEDVLEQSGQTIDLARDEGGLFAALARRQPRRVQVVGRDPDRRERRKLNAGIAAIEVTIATQSCDEAATSKTTSRYETATVLALVTCSQT